MELLKRWGPLAGTVVLIATVVLRAFGLDDAAKALDLVGSITGLSGQSSVSATELTAAAAALTGVVLKVLAQVAKARQP